MKYAIRDIRERDDGLHGKVRYYPSDVAWSNWFEVGFAVLDWVDDKTLKVISFKPYRNYSPLHQAILGREFKVSKPIFEEERRVVMQ